MKDVCRAQLVVGWGMDNGSRRTIRDLDRMAAMEGLTKEHHET